MLDSIYGNGLMLLGLWVATSLVMLYLWGLLAWVVVVMLSRRDPHENDQLRINRSGPLTGTSTGGNRE
jgi:hypothetical protein